MRRLRHLARFANDLVGFARANKAWWIVPLVAVLLLLALLIVVASTSAPLIYTVF